MYGKVIDVGAGSTAEIFAAEFGDRYHALDIGDSYKLTTRQQQSALHHVIDIDRKKLPFKDREFDSVLCLDVLEHVDDIHLVYDELFRISARYVIISLPNNWPGLIWSQIVGHNITHTAGYGLGPGPKLPGQRHKHFFNFEEACQFLFGRMPPEFTLRHAAFLFEHGSDGLLASMPGLTRYFRLVGQASSSDARRTYGPGGVAIWACARAVYLPARCADVLLSAALYGWGPRVRFYNLFCRQVWAVFERVGQ